MKKKRNPNPNGKKKKRKTLTHVTREVVEDDNAPGDLDRSSNSNLALNNRFVGPTGSVKRFQM